MVCAAPTATEAGGLKVAEAAPEGPLKTLQYTVTGPTGPRVFVSCTTKGSGRVEPTGPLCWSLKICPIVGKVKAVVKVKVADPLGLPSAA